MERHFPRRRGSSGEQGVGARHKEVSGLQCLWAEAERSAKVSSLLPLDPPAPQGDHSGRGRPEGQSGSEKEWRWEERMRL